MQFKPEDGSRSILLLWILYGLLIGGSSWPSYRQNYTDEARLFSSPRDNFTDEARLFSTPRQNYTDEVRLFSSHRQNYIDEARLFSSLRQNYTDEARLFSTPRDNFTDEARLFSTPRQNYTDEVRLFSSPRQNYIDEARLFSSLRQTGTKQLSSSRQNNAAKTRQFSIFEIVSFPNTECWTDNKVRNGTCYASGECQDYGGVMSGVCAGGYGVCCIFDTGCGGRVEKNYTYFSSSSPGYTTNMNTCTMEICRSDKQICQVRLDFDSFILNDAETQSNVKVLEPNLSSHGQCLVDRFQVAVPGGRSSPTICGTNSGYHMYLDIGDSCNLATFNLGQGTLLTREWTIRVIYLSCDDISRAPDGCLQYYQGSTGNIESFNFNSRLGTQLTDQSYSVCIRPERGYCNICFSSGTSDTSMFRVSSTAGDEMNCADTMDYISIPGGSCQDSKNSRISTTHSLSLDRYCGPILDCGERVRSAVGDGSEPLFRVVSAKQYTVCTKIRPYILHFHTDSFASVTPESNANIGFGIEYWQTAC